MAEHRYALSIIITAHSEGILLHRTLLSIRRCLAQIEGRYSYELLLHVDNPTPKMQVYLDDNANSEMLKGVRIYTNSFKDLSASRNFLISKSQGRFISTIDSDDLMSKNWLKDGLDFLTSHPYGKYIAHTEYTIEFGGFNSIVKKYGSIDKDTDSFLNVWSARWNSVIIAPSSFMKEEPYEPNSPGYGYEDWHLSCRFIHAGITSVLIPESVIFVRRKESDSEWSRQKQSYSVLRKNPILDYTYFRALPAKSIYAKPVSSPAVSKKTGLKSRAKDTVRNVAAKNQKVLAIAKKIHSRIKQPTLPVVSGQSPNSVPLWLKSEWSEMHEIDRSVYPSDTLLQAATYHTITDDHYRVAFAYWEILQLLYRNSYDYFLFVPWLVEGGADLFAINYANSVAKAGKSVAVFATNDGDTKSSWANKLSEAVDFIPFAEITNDLAMDQKYRVMEQLIENGDVHILHTLNSVFGYDFFTTHETYLTATNKKLVATAYSESKDSNGYTYGFSHTHVPVVYEILSLLTTDNEAIKEMWVRDYGFSDKKIAVHHQPMNPSDASLKHSGNTTHPKNAQPRALWASRVSPEKLPHLLVEIAKALPHVNFEAYGTESGISPAIFSEAPNIKYMGPFKNIFKDIKLNIYDVFVYTSAFDGTPNTLIEIGMCGLPIVAPAVGGIPAILPDKYLVKNSQSVKEYVNLITHVFNNKAAAMDDFKAVSESLIKQHSFKEFDRVIAELLKSL